MAIGHVTQTGNISIPKEWRDELGIAPNTGVLLEKKADRIIIQPLRKKGETFSSIDDEIRRKRIKFTRDEAIKDDLFS
ncbi:AbrB/MazE/SpoVT family DNA-binding domain-containing protein [Candidatus Woesearchaeota archaeon]|nr:AbrB/MazE/SpoVT family DNA-binding domain-containing protein [Candidatus Woesearchaeota archaeon]